MIFTLLCRANSAISISDSHPPALVNHDGLFNVVVVIVQDAVQHPSQGRIARMGLVLDEIVPVVADAKHDIHATGRVRTMYLRVLGEEIAKKGATGPGKAAEEDELLYHTFTTPLLVPAVVSTQRSPVAMDG